MNSRRTNPIRRIIQNEGGMEAIQAICLIGVAATILLALTQMSRRSVRLMDDSTHQFEQAASRLVTIRPADRAPSPPAPLKPRRLRVLRRERAQGQPSQGIETREGQFASLNHDSANPPTFLLAVGNGSNQAKPPAAWNSLQTEFEQLTKQLLELNEKEALRGERAELLGELTELWARIGAPGEKSKAELAQLRNDLREFKNARAAERGSALQSWAVMKEEYEAERKRLANSQEPSDQFALTYLKRTYERTLKRKTEAGKYLRWEDIAALGTEITQEQHIDKGWQAALRKAQDAAAHGKTSKAEQNAKSGWPWPKFKAAQVAIESGAATADQQALLRGAVGKQLDSAIRYQIRESVKEMVKLGESKAAANDWARRTLARSRAAADKLLDRIPLAGKDAHKMSHRLHVAGKITIYLDVGVSLIDIWAAPPSQRPKKIVVHGSRIAGGLAGATTGARAGAKIGGLLGPKGAAVGGIVGGIVGGYVGATAAKSIATFVADTIWPPEDTYTESVER